MVTAQYLLKGIMYALEQCSLLLSDAVDLYNRGSHASAIVLAAFAREELGRSRILHELRRGIVEHGATVSLDDIKHQCEDHVLKQSQAQISTVQRTSGNDILAQLLQVKSHSHPQYDEYREAEKQLNAITKTQRKRTPENRHNARMHALYVEPKESGIGWNRPSEISQEKARHFLEDIANDYGLEYHWIQKDIQYTDPEFSQALAAWAERPELLPPRWPLQFS